VLEVVVTGDLVASSRVVVGHRDWWRMLCDVINAGRQEWRPYVRDFLQPHPTTSHTEKVKQALEHLCQFLEFQTSAFSGWCSQTLKCPAAENQVPSGTKNRARVGSQGSRIPSTV